MATAKLKLTLQSPPNCVNTPSCYVTLCQFTLLNPLWHSSKLCGRSFGGMPGKGGNLNICSTISPICLGTVVCAMLPLPVSVVDAVSSFCPIRGNVVSKSFVSQCLATSLKETNARASVPSGLRYRARFSSIGGVENDSVGVRLCFNFFGDPLKMLKTPPLRFVGVGVRAGSGSGASALNWATMCGSRRTLRVRVNSNFECSILHKAR